MKNMIELDWLKKWNEYTPQNVAIVDGESDRRYTYRDFYWRAQRVAHHLRTQFHITRGDRVALLATNDVDTLFLFYGLQRLGAILIPINFRLSSREISHVLEDSGAKLFIAQENFSEVLSNLNLSSLHTLSYNAVKSIIEDSNPITATDITSSFEDPVMILYTSGTTGVPKGAIITHEMIFWNSINTSLRLNLSQSDITVSFLPFFHTSGWNVLNTPFFHRGAQVVFLPKFDPAQILALAEKHRMTILFGVPTTMEMLRQQPHFATTNLTSVRYAIVGGEPMPIPLIEAWQRRGIPIRQGYGLTEFGPNVFSLNEEDCIRKKGSIGFANFYIQTKIVDEHGIEVKADQVGELLLRGPMCMAGYWQNPKATAETIRDGWLYTGDLVRQDAEGYFYVVGRKKDMFISGGENVYPAEVEQFLCTHPQISEVAVIGVADAKWGEVGRAFVVPKPQTQLSVDDVMRYCSGQLAKYKIPKHITFLPELPKGDSGKILKRALTELEP